MDSITFATLACWVQCRADIRLEAQELRQLHDIVVPVAYDDHADVTAVPLYVQELAKSGKKIEAIKELRACNGLSLKDAKDAIEALG